MRILELEVVLHPSNHRPEPIGERSDMVLVETVLFAALAEFLGLGLFTHQITTSADGTLSAKHETIQ